jgi:hypothetical protein
MYFQMSPNLKVQPSLHWFSQNLKTLTVTYAYLWYTISLKSYYKCRRYEYKFIEPLSKVGLYLSPNHFSLNSHFHEGIKRANSVWNFAQLWTRTYKIKYFCRFYRYTDVHLTYKFSSSMCVYASRQIWSRSIKKNGKCREKFICALKEGLSLSQLWSMFVKYL